MEYDPEFQNPRRYNLRQRNPPIKKEIQKNIKDISKKGCKNLDNSKTTQNKKTLKKKVKIPVEIEETESTEDSNIENIEETENESDSEENEYDLDDSFIDNKGDNLNDKQLITLLTNAISNKLSESLIDEEYSETDSDEEEEQEVRKKPDKSHRKQYDKIKSFLRTERPTIQKLLQTEIPFKERCDLFERIKVLDNMNKYTEEYLMFKNDIIIRFKKYAESSMKQKEYIKYNKVEDELANQINSKTPLKYKILSCKQSMENKKVMYEQYLIFKTLSHCDENYAKMLEWFNWALSIPTEKKELNIQNTNEDRNRFSTELRQKLDSVLYGIDNVKQRMCTIVNDYLTIKQGGEVLSDTGFKGNMLALVGSPGVGKTLIMRTLAKCLDIPFQQISLGGAKDSSFLEGHSFTYIGSKPGAIMSALKKMKFTNGIIFFDEFDKLVDSEKGLEVAYSLLHIIDATQNQDFKDKYLAELGIDLSNIWFCFSMNDDKLVNRILIDRVQPIVKVKDYTVKDKIRIVHDHLLPNALKTYGYTKEDIDITDDSITYLVNRIEKEAGVRRLKESIRGIVRNLHFLKTNRLEDNTLGEIKVDFDILNRVDVTKKIMLSNDVIDKCIQKEKIDIPLSMYL